VYNTGAKDKEGVGREERYTYTPVPAIACPNFPVMLVNEHNTAQYSSYTTTRHIMNNKPRFEM
jgi:hypothetical protein